MNENSMDYIHLTDDKLLCFYHCKGRIDLLNIVETEHGISVDENIRREMGPMCNLGEGIRDDAIADMIINMYRKGYPLEQIAEIVEKSIEEVSAVIRKRGIALAQS